MVKLHQFHQVGRCTRLEPVAPYLLLGKGIQQTEGIVHPHRLITEMVAVVVFLQQSASLCVIHAQIVCQRMNVLLKIRMKFRIADTAELRIAVVHRNVHQVVQVAEHTHLAELRHARQHGKINRTVARLERPVKRLERVAETSLQLRVCNGLKHRLVVLINQNHHLLPRLLVRPLDDIHETFFWHTVFFLIAIQFLPSLQILIQNTQQRGIIVIVAGIQIHVQYGMYRPVFLQTFHGKSLEKFLLPLEISLQRRNHQALPEPTGTAQKIILPCLYQVI